MSERESERSERRGATRRWVIVIGLVVVGLVGVGVAFFFSFRGEREPRAFASAIRRGEAAVVLHEGLPHPVFEAALLERERASGSVEELHGYAFYREPLALTGEEAREITEAMASPDQFLPFSGEKKCGGFHPDYAVEWRRGGEVYTALVCFGCEEVKLFGPGMASRHDMRAAERFGEVLGRHHKNRPAGAKY